MMTANSAWSIRRRRSNSEGKNDPVRSLVIDRSRSPAAVVIVFERTRCGEWSLVDALVRLGADERGRLSVDQLLQHHFQRLTEHVGGVGGPQCVEHLEQGRLGQGHRVVLLRDFLGGFFRSLTRWLSTFRNQTGSCTTTGDLTPFCRVTLQRCLHWGHARPIFTGGFRGTSAARRSSQIRSHGSGDAAILAATAEKGLLL